MRRVVVIALLLVLVLVAVVPAVLVRDWYGGQVERLEMGPVPGDVGLDVYWVAEDRIVRMGLEEYVAGVVAAEMPGRFHLEALKAQAVAARTYAVKRIRAFGGPGCSHYPGADLCTDPAHAQAWHSPQELRDKWGILGYLMYWRRINQAVEATRGLILTYDSQPVDAVYHSTSGGRTEDSSLVWGNEVPYLVGVESPHESHSPYWETREILSLEEMASRLGLPISSLQGAGQDLVNLQEKSPSGRALVVKIAGQTYTGIDLRQKLELNSTMIMSVTTSESGVEFLTRGWGHGVGMSQYGADGMANDGASYSEILAHYYRGTRLRPIFSE